MRSPAQATCPSGRINTAGVADLAENRELPHAVVFWAFREEPIGDTTLIKHLDGAGVKPTGSSITTIDPRQRQFARQYQPVRAGP